MINSFRCFATDDMLPIPNQTSDTLVSPSPTMYVPTQVHGAPSDSASSLAWRQVPVRRLKSRAVRILWNPRFLKEVLDGNSKLIFRSPNADKTNPIVLADILVMGDETVSIEGQL